MDDIDAAARREANGWEARAKRAEDRLTEVEWNLGLARDEAAKDVGKAEAEIQRLTAALEVAEADRDHWKADRDDLAKRISEANRRTNRAERTLRAVAALADDLVGEAEWIESNFMPGPNSTGAAADLREQAAKIRAVLARTE